MARKPKEPPLPPIHKTLAVKGNVWCGNSTRNSENDDENGSVWVGMTDVVSQLEDASGIAAVYVNDELVAAGAIHCTLGNGTEYTPMEGDQLVVGKEDVRDLLCSLAGQKIALRIDMALSRSIHGD
jgi:hypothetical protein